MNGNKSKQKIVSRARPPKAERAEVATPTMDLPPAEGWTGPSRVKFKPLRQHTEPPNDSFVTQPPETTRSGRAIKARRNFDNEVYGDEMHMALDSYEKAAAVRKNSNNGLQRSSSTLASSPAQRPSRQNIVFGESDSRVLTSSPPIESLKQKISERVRGAYDFLSSLDYIPTQLPLMTDSMGQETDWTASDLTYLYILAYHDEKYSICDLIADIWIISFQQRDQSARKIWRENRCLEAEKVSRKWISEFAMPWLDPRVTDFNYELLNDLYANTRKKSGARMLWADAMALTGHRIENTWDEKDERGDKDKLHPDLIFDVGCTALRMVGRRAMLNIEKMDEDAWCARYHEHPVWEPCYRQIAKNQAERLAGSSVRQEESDEESEED